MLVQDWTEELLKLSSPNDLDPAVLPGVRATVKCYWRACGKGNLRREKLCAMLEKISSTTESTDRMRSFQVEKAMVDFPDGKKVS